MENKVNYSFSCRAKRKLDVQIDMSMEQMTTEVPVQKKKITQKRACNN